MANFLPASQLRSGTRVQLYGGPVRTVAKVEPEGYEVDGKPVLRVTYQEPADDLAGEYNLTVPGERWRLAE